MSFRSRGGVESIDRLTEYVLILLRTRLKHPHQSTGPASKPATADAASGPRPAAAAAAPAAATERQAQGIVAVLVVDDTGSHYSYFEPSATAPTREPSPAAARRPRGQRCVTASLNPRTWIDVHVLNKPYTHKPQPPYGPTPPPGKGSGGSRRRTRRCGRR